MSIDIFSYILGKKVGMGRVLDAAFPTAEGPFDFAWLDDGDAGVPVRSLKVAIDPSKFIGWTGAAINVSKRNMLSPETFADTTESAGVFTKGSSYTELNHGHPIRLRPGKYTFSAKTDGVFTRVQWWRVQGAGYNEVFFSQSGEYSVAYLDLSAPADVYIIASAGDFEQPMLEIGQARSEYTAYEGKTYTVSWYSEAGTLFGGTLTDNGNGTWTLTNLFGLLEMDGSQNLSVDNARQSNSTFTCYIRLDDLERKDDDYRKALIASTMPTLSTCAYSTDEYLQEADGVSIGIAGYRPARSSVASNYIYFSFRKSDYPSVVDASSAKSWFESHPTQIVYKLTEPESYTLTFESVKTMLGENFIFADCGPIEEISYFADPDIVREKLGKE